MLKLQIWGIILREFVTTSDPFHIHEVLLSIINMNMFIIAASVVFYLDQMPG